MLKKIEQYIFYLFLFSIPFQTRKLLWYDGWKFNEWTSISVYATDMLIALLIVFWIVDYLRRDSKFTINFKFTIFKKPDLYLILFLIFAAISIKNALNPLVGWFQWIKLLEFALFYWYLAGYAFKKFGIYNSFLVLVWGGTLQAFIGTFQFIKQSSIGLRFLGEGVINDSLPGIASFYAEGGEKIIRAYGTFPHPNVLAAFLFLSLFGFYFVYLYSRLHAEHDPLADSWDKFFLVSYVLMLFALFTTFSRTVIFAWFVSFCIRGIFIVGKKHYRIVFGTDEGRKRIKAILLAGLVALVLFGSLYTGEILNRINISSQDQAVQLRGFYNEEAVSGGVNLFGVGLGNFVSWLADKNPYMASYVYQPVHNIYLLIYSEIGIFGLIIFILFLVVVIRDYILKTKLLKSYHLSLLFFFGAILFVGLFDHFLWTLQQGRIVFWFSLALLTFITRDDIIKNS